MRVGVYIDGFNLYYGGRGNCGHSTQGWRWLDLKSLAVKIVEQQPLWCDAQIQIVTFCTARISGAPGDHGAQHQDVYLRALASSGSVTHISYGNYVSRVSTAPLAVANNRGKPILTTPMWPLKVRGQTNEDLPDATFMASIARREEKGSDVNVASHLLIDSLTEQIDAAVVISNDSDLEFPIREMRKRIPLGVVNPTPNYLAGKLSGTASDGVGQHWWYRMTKEDWYQNQLPEFISKSISKPRNW